MNPRITVRATRTLRVALTDEGAEIRFARGWDVYADARYLTDIWVGQSTDGRLYGLDQRRILVVTGPREAARVAFTAYRRSKTNHTPEAPVSDGP